MQLNGNYVLGIAEKLIYLLAILFSCTEIRNR